MKTNNKTKERKVKAWAVLFSYKPLWGKQPIIGGHGQSSLGIYRFKKDGKKHFPENEVIPCTITFSLPTKNKSKKV